MRLRLFIIIVCLINDNTTKIEFVSVVYRYFKIHLQKNCQKYFISYLSNDITAMVLIESIPNVAPQKPYIEQAIK